MGNKNKGQLLKNLICPHCKSNNNERKIQAPKEWGNGQWRCVCLSCDKEFDAHIQITVHALPTHDQMQEQLRKAKADEEKAREENGDSPDPNADKGPSDNGNDKAETDRPTVPGGEEPDKRERKESEGVGTTENNSASVAGHEAGPSIQ